MRTKLLALTAAIGMVLFAVGPGVATAAAGTTDDGTLAVGVSQAGNQEATVTVTDDDTAVENASVSVEALDNGTYAGTGDYATGENGTVELSAPEENVTVEVTATVGNETATTTAELTADAEETTGSFGARVSSFVRYLLQHGSTNIGPEVAEFVTQNNPGNAPDHAGPPEDAGPERASAEGENASDGNETAAERRGERGPSERANAPEERGQRGEQTNASEGEENETEETEAEASEEADADEEATEEETDGEDADGGSNDDDSGPPAHANGNGDGR
ncbi:hypothetical protein [Haloarcula nitratireducens]|uniref:DNA primase n=1 Tax=Haloarcula nitratireducens TaxID=2487749 RepID=A0AAW4PD42_9EURY|nr:hypothetical protein [Halomicroarcula nitratireducens]MBX0295831.1 hypothetical protein [Halomicroarcula nitratireducens]